MAKRRDFGQIRTRASSKGDAKSYLAKYPTPVEAFSDYAGLKAFQYKTFKSYDDAATWLNQARKAIAQGIWVPPKAHEAEAKAKAVRFMDYAVQWIDARTKPTGKPLASSTTIKYRELLASHLRPAFGAKLIGEITRDDVLNWWHSCGSEPSPVHVRAYTLLSSIMRSAAHDRIDDQGDTLIGHSPCDLRMPKPKTKHKTVNASMAQIREAYDSDAMPERLKLTVYLGGVLGLRIGEILALQRRDVDLATRTLHVTATLKPKLVDGRQVITRGSTKTADSNRTVPIPEVLAECIRGHLERFTDKGATALLFPARKGGLMRENVYSWYWRQARATVPGLQSMRFHDLRHTALTRFMEDGATANMVMQLGGHSDIRIASKYQDTTSKDFARQVTAKVSGQLADVLGSESKPVEQESEPVASAPGELVALAKTLEAMPLQVRCGVLRGLDADRRKTVLALFDATVQTETMTKLLREVL